MTDMFDLAARAKSAAPKLAAASIATRDAFLMRLADALIASQTTILTANSVDVERAALEGRADAFIERLSLNGGRLAKMAAAVGEIAQLASPLGRIEQMDVRPNGLRVGRMRIPLGVIAFIYESRPNVTSDASALCVKAGNAIILKGGRDAQKSNEAITHVIRTALCDSSLPEDTVQLITTRDREEMKALLGLDEHIDLVIPRGGEGLIRFVAENSRIPVLKHYKGVCHVFIDETADTEMAVAICDNGKVQRPSVCNSVETILIHDRAIETLEPVARRLTEQGVTLHGCPKTKEALAKSGIDIVAATDEDFHAEYLSLDVAVRIVASLDDAMAHIRQFGSDHTEAIVTGDHSRAMRFISEVDSSCVLVNASTRFADGGQLGLGAEIGISTTKLHAFGPMGLEELTARKFVVFGDGQIRS